MAKTGTKKPSPPQLVKYRWQPGVSANPKGRPKGTSPISTLKSLFKYNPEALKIFVVKYLEDPNNAKHIVEMIDGKPTQKHEGISSNLIAILQNAKQEGSDTATEEDTN